MTGNKFMKMKNIKCSLTITRPSCSNGDKYISIQIKDENSRIQFFDGKISLSDFAEALTGLSGLEIISEVRGLENVGKVRVVEPRSVECPLDTYSRGELEQWIEDNCQEQGWIVSSYLGSQSSVQRKGNKNILHYSVVKFCDE